jgi:hypothetical protein
MHECASGEPSLVTMKPRALLERESFLCEKWAKLRIACQFGGGLPGIDVFGIGALRLKTELHGSDFFLREGNDPRNEF